ncbi:MFS transporter [Haloarchaeobius iranensis]|uniref:Major Facilitator Superfamily protein n=1 Tax=Haloarchaeobius iranensis TaxID=996166 RepID=A0A1G9U076_9EURY|nr:MFS transporter [Haloarchaeobius iranensis]SDM52925.1 Major Facilitator Superfamily protein [Haloarchaeobius iranensis]
MESTARSARLRLALVVWGVLVSQVFLYPGLSDLVVALGAPAGIQAGMWFLVAEFAAFVTFAGVWGALSDVTGKRVPWVVGGAAGGAACYLLLTQLPALGLGWAVVLVVRLAGGALTIGAFSLAITMLMDLSGGHGRNMGAAGIAIGLGAALGSVVGGQLSTLGALTPLYASAAVLLSAGLLAATVPDRTPTKSPGVGDILARLRDRPSLGVPYAFGFIDRSTAGFFSLVGVYYFRDVFDLGAAMAGLTLACFFLPFALLQYPFGSLSDRVGRFLPVVGGSVVYGLTIVAVGLAPVYLLAAAAMVAAGVCGALMAPATMALVTDIAAADGRGAAMGGFNVFGSLGFLTGFLVGGLVVESANYLTAFLVVGGLELAIALVALPAVRRVALRVQEQPS